MHRAIANNLPSGISSYTIAAWVKSSTLQTYGIVEWGTQASSQMTGISWQQGSGGSISNYWSGNDLTTALNDANCQGMQ